MAFDLSNLKGHTTRTSMIKKGLYEKGKQEVVCPSCHEHIATIVTVDDDNVKLSHVIVCPCGEESFKFHTEGNYVYDLDGCKAMDIEYVTKDLVKLKLEKK